MRAIQLRPRRTPQMSLKVFSIVVKRPITMAKSVRMPIRPAVPERELAMKLLMSRTISGVENARLVVGNAGGVKIATNGKDIGPIGLPGQVRTVTLSPEGPKIGAGPLL